MNLPVSPVGRIDQRTIWLKNWSYSSQPVHVVVQRWPASVVKATALPRPYVHVARIVAFCVRVGSGDVRTTSTSEFSFTRREHEAADRRERIAEPLHDFVLRRDLRADGRLRLVDQRPGDAAGFALVDLRQRVGVVDFVILAAGVRGDVLQRVAAAGRAVRADGDRGDRDAAVLERVDRAAAGRRRDRRRW